MGRAKNQKSFSKKKINGEGRGQPKNPKYLNIIKI